MKAAARAAITDSAVRSLVQRSFGLRFQDRDGSLASAVTAVRLADRSSTLSPDARGAAWTQFGNALRAADRLPDAETALKVADYYLSSGGKDARTRAILMEVWSATARERKRYGAALTMARTAAAAYEQLADTDGRVRSLVLAGLVLNRQRKFAAALQCATDAMDLAGTDTSLAVTASICHLVVNALLGAGKVQAATCALSRFEPALHNLNEPAALVKLEWLRARLAVALGQADVAKKVYVGVVAALEGMACPHELAEVRAELAAL